MNFLNFNTISKKFLIPTLALSAVLLVGLGFFMASSNNKTIRSMMDSKGNAMADFMNKISVGYYLNFDFASLDEFVKEITKDPEVEFAVFYDAQKKPITKISKEPDNAASLMVYERKISDDKGNLIGYLELGYNKKKLTESIRNSFIIVAGGILIALLLLSFGIIALVRNVITKRVKGTVEIIGSVAEGDLTRHLKEGSADELGELARCFNLLIKNLKGIISAVQSGAANVSATVAQLSSTAENLSNGTKEQSLRTEQVASAMEEMSQTIILRWQKMQAALHPHRKRRQA